MQSVYLTPLLWRIFSQAGYCNPVGSMSLLVVFLMRNITVLDKEHLW
ncbi:hypothetical protein BTN50_0523 [Candidatus Enterovibrio altilux]|uniref:Uncharacterized protein n=1 Tax=Candidatus Enterovibrio altilux TaxID=1927128 RepID=A0A291B7T1_9GAMM|nr:hypothetical protein BTN50_0523 [Candidatus Enterovibrio luxaltus]